MQRKLKFEDCLHARPRPKGMDVICTLQHFSIITYAVDPVRFEGLLPEQFALDLVDIDGHPKALLSVVPFMDRYFSLAVLPRPRFEMGQTNYRLYIVDRKTGEKCVWFFGTTLDSWLICVPRYMWNLPWHPGNVHFTCEYDSSSGRYVRYEMETQSRWAPAHVRLTQSQHEEGVMAGFPDRETALVYLTHPLTGYYYRRDGQVGTYSVWHERLAVTTGELLEAKFDLLSRCGWVTLPEQQSPHSVLIDPLNEFTVYLPPVLVKASST